MAEDNKSCENEVQNPEYVLKSDFEKLKADYTNIAGQLENLKKLETQIGAREAPQPTAHVSNDNQFSPEKAIEKVIKWVNGDRETDCTVSIPESWLRSHVITQVKTPNGIMETFKNSYNKITEALSFSGTHATQGIDTDIVAVPGSISRVPVRQFAKQKVLGQGEDRARFYKTTIPTPATQTAGTTATESNMTVTPVEVVPSTITGTYLKVNTDDIENNPYDTVSVVTQAMAASYEDFIATDMLDTVSKEGTLTPGKWIRGDSGAVITGSDIANATFDPTGLAVAVEYLDERGYLYGGVRPVAFLHQQQFRELIEDTELTNYIAFSEPNAFRQYRLPELYGTEIVVTNTIELKDNSTNDAYNAIVCVPNNSYGVALKRDVTLKFHEVPEDNQIRVTVNWRAKAGVINADSIVRVSTSK